MCYRAALARVARFFSSHCRERSMPYFVVDVVPGTTHCGFFLDGALAASAVNPVDAGGMTCRFDLSGVAPGDHTIQADARSVDPVWGPIVSAKSAPYQFTKPASGGAPPSGPRIVP
jgi:hypothetical protein